MNGLILPPAAAILGLLSWALVPGCAPGPSPAPDPEVEARVVEIAAPAAQALLRELGARLTERVGSDGVADAVRFCSARAQALTDEVQERVGRELPIKRTSLRYRNPVNAPDALERRALRYFRTALEREGELPEHRVQRVGGDTYRYYRPLTVGGLCVRCHGPVDELDPEVRRLLRERYPDDRATGYEVGDFRGVIRVTVPADLLSDTPSARDEAAPGTSRGPGR